MNAGYMNVESSETRSKLEGYGCDLIIVRPKETKSLDYLLKMVRDREIQTIVVGSLADLGLLASQLTAFYRALDEADMGVVFLNTYIGISSEQFNELLKQFIETEALLFQMSVNEGIKKSVLKGKKGGRPKISPELVFKISDLRNKHKYTYREIASLLDVSLGTVYKYSNEAPE